DIYALGCILFELVTGRAPFDGDLRQLIEAHQRFAPPAARALAPEIPPALDELITRMLRKHPAGRPPTMVDVQRELERIAAPPAPDHRGRIGLVVASAVAFGVALAAAIATREPPIAHASAAPAPTEPAPVLP
ncbi:MAG: serine/threonine protein kinase, partial [Kofleriaceae bacterium]